jgi:hypothetical protein
LAPAMYRGFVDINVEAIVLRRPSVRRYFESCGLEGAPRVLCEWFGVETAARGGADAPRRNAAKLEPEDQIFEQQASNGGLEWVLTG